MPGETWAVVVAAGSGERLAADRPKAFVRLGGRTMLAWSLAMLDDHDLIDGIVMVVPEEYEERASLLADDLCATKIAAAVPGGATRPVSVAAGVACVPEGAAFVLVHDAARPLVAARASSTAWWRHCGPVPRASCRRCRWPTRSSAWRPTAASPRRSTGARCAPCRRRRASRSRCCARRSPTHAGDATDCASMVEQLGRTVVCVEGDERAFKVTTPADLARAEQLAGEDETSAPGQRARRRPSATPTASRWSGRAPSEHLAHHRRVELGHDALGGLQAVGAHRAEHRDAAQAGGQRGDDADLGVLEREHVACGHAPARAAGGPRRSRRARACRAATSSAATISVDDA